MEYKEPFMEVILQDMNDVVCLSVDEEVPDAGKFPLI